MGDRIFYNYITLQLVLLLILSVSLIHSLNHTQTPISSVTRCGGFCKFLVPNFLAKEKQIFGDFLGLFGKHQFIIKLLCLLFGQIGKVGQLFYSNVWSH